MSAVPKKIIKMAFCVLRGIIFLSLISICLCDRAELHHKKHHHHHHSLFHEFHHLHYLIFLALKVKVILVIGTVWAFALLFGKIFAVIKMSEYMKKNYDHDNHHHHEKIVYVSSPYGSPNYDHHGLYGKSFETSVPAASQNIANKIPSESIYLDNVQQSYGPPSTRPPNSGRSSHDGADIYQPFDQFLQIIRQMNLTEIVFKDMHLDTENCKRKFVCEADFNTKQSSLLSSAFSILSDDSYQEYKTNHTIWSIEECEKLYPNCHQNMEKL